jgi:aryl-alcohol dehydrogenase-like predicted oxidoreductase
LEKAISGVVCPDLIMSNLAANQKLVDTVKAVAAREAAAPAQVALAWVLTVARDAAPIPGTKRRAYLDGNLGAVNVFLTAEDTTELNRLALMAVGDRYSAAMANMAER